MQIQHPRIEASLAMGQSVGDRDIPWPSMTRLTQGSGKALPEKLFPDNGTGVIFWP